jgi:hypothetical protein
MLQVYALHNVHLSWLLDARLSHMLTLKLAKFQESNACYGALCGNMRVAVMHDEACRHSLLP